MINRLTTLAGTLAAFGAIALGTSAIASAQSSHARHASTPAAAHHGRALSGASTTADQSGSQTAPDTGTAAGETAGEAGGVEADGPGGHQDPNGINVDQQFQGQQ